MLVCRACGKATPKGFEPLRAEPNGFLVHLLSHSDKVSYQSCNCLPHPHMAIRVAASHKLLSSPADHGRELAGWADYAKQGVATGLAYANAAVSGEGSFSDLNAQTADAFNALNHDGETTTSSPMPSLDTAVVNEPPPAQTTACALAAAPHSPLLRREPFAPGGAPHCIGAAAPAGVAPLVGEHERVRARRGARLGRQS